MVVNLSGMYFNVALIDLVLWNILIQKRYLQETHYVFVLKRKEINFWTGRPKMTFPIL